MRRFLFAAALALAGAVGFANTADAQYVYGYQTYVPSAGVVVRGQTYTTPFGLQTTQGYYSPYTGLGARQSYYADVWGNQGVRIGGYNPYSNFGYRSGYNYTPYGFNGPAFYPYGYSYSRW